MKINFKNDYETITATINSVKKAILADTPHSLYQHTIQFDKVWSYVAQGNDVFVLISDWDDEHKKNVVKKTCFFEDLTIEEQMTFLTRFNEVSTKVFSDMQYSIAKSLNAQIGNLEVEAYKTYEEVIYSQIIEYCRKKCLDYYNLYEIELPAKVTPHLVFAGNNVSYSFKVEKIVGTNELKLSECHHLVFLGRFVESTSGEPIGDTNSIMIDEADIRMLDYVVDILDKMIQCA